MENDIISLEDVDIKLTVEFCNYLVDKILSVNNGLCKSDIFIQFLKDTYLDL